MVDNVILTLARAYDSSMELGSPHVCPRALLPLVSAAQAIKVERDSNALGGKLSLEAEEDMTLLGEAFCDKNGNPISASDRRRYLSKEATLTQHVFDTDLTWTFHIWQHFVDFSTYELHAIKRFALGKYLNG